MFRANDRLFGSPGCGNIFARFDGAECGCWEPGSWANLEPGDLGTDGMFRTFACEKALRPQKKAGGPPVDSGNAPCV